MFDLSGRTALITGSTRGIGFELAKGLAEAGAKVLVNSRQGAAVDKKNLRFFRRFRRLRRLDEQKDGWLQGCRRGVS